MKNNRKLVSVSFRNEEWEYIQNVIPPFTKVSKLFKYLLLKAYNYPFSSENLKTSNASFSGGAVLRKKASSGSNFVSSSEFARMCGVSPMAISKLVKVGKLIRGANKKLDINNPINNSYLEKKSGITNGSVLNKNDNFIQDGNVVVSFIAEKFYFTKNLTDFVPFEEIYCDFLDFCNGNCLLSRARFKRHVKEFFLTVDFGTRVVSGRRILVCRGIKKKI